MLRTLNNIFNPFQALVYAYDKKDKSTDSYKAASRLMHINLANRVWDTFQVFDGGTSVWFFNIAKKPNLKVTSLGAELETRPGLFDYLTLGVFRGLHAAHTYTNRLSDDLFNTLKAIIYNGTDNSLVKRMNTIANPVLRGMAKVSVGILMGALLLSAQIILAPLALGHVIGNGLVRHIASAVLTLAVLPLVLIAHGIAKLVQYVKEQHLLKKIPAVEEGVAFNNSLTTVAQLRQDMKERNTSIASAQVNTINVNNHMVTFVLPLKVSAVNEVPAAICKVQFNETTLESLAEVNPSARQKLGHEMTAYRRNRC